MKHILVVEDEQHLAFGIKYNLEAEGFEVTVAGDGPAALVACETAEAPVDLIVLDIMLPGMSGYAVCEKLRQAGNEVPILMLSARTLSEDRTRGFDAGADQYLMKPFDLDELLARVNNLLARYERRKQLDLPVSHDGGTFRFGRAEVNFDTFEVKVDGKLQRMTHMDMKLLRYFVVNAGRVVSREEILEQVWGYSNIPTTRTIDNFVLKFRRVFEDDPAKPRYFLSVRGTGYRFVPEENAPPAPDADGDE